MPGENILLFGGGISIRNAGFTWLEVLLALSVVFLVWPLLDRYQSIGVLQSQVMSIESQAISRLVLLSHLFSLNPSNLDEWYQTWNQHNALLLPQGFGEFEQHEHKQYLRIAWQSLSCSSWRCSAPAIPRFSCLEIVRTIS